MGSKTLMRQFRQLVKTINNFSNGQAKVTEFSDNMDEMSILVRPNDGLYKGGEFLFKIELEVHRYPKTAPVISCETPIYHPNIDAYNGCLFDNVCMNILTDWEPSIDLEGVVQALLYLFYHPNLDDPLSSMFTSEISTEDYEANVKKSLVGGVVNGFLFEKNNGQCGKINCCATVVADDKRFQNGDVISCRSRQICTCAVSKETELDCGRDVTCETIGEFDDSDQTWDHPRYNNSSSRCGRRSGIRRQFSRFASIFKHVN